MTAARLDHPRPAAAEADVLSALAGADGLFVVIDPLGRVTSAGGAALSLLAPDGRPLEGRPLPAALRGAPVLEEVLREALDGRAGVARCTIGETDFDVRAAPLHDGEGDVVGALAFAGTAPPPPATPAASAVSHTATALREHQPAAAVPRGDAEPLRGRATIETALASAVRAARRGLASALLYARVDGLRLVNRAYGREAGDALLDDTAAALRELFPHPAVICRVGSADFGVVLEHLPGDPTASATAAAARAVDRLEGMVTLTGAADVRRTARAVVALIRTGDESPEELLQLADDEVREQAAGRAALAADSRRVRIEAREDVRMTARLRGAGEREELRLLYQPIYALDGERLYGVEALLRWTDLELGPVSPGRFIPLAEESGAIHELGGWVVDELSRHAGGWGIDGASFQMHFNASAVELQRPGYAREVLRRIARHEINPSRFVVEVTESTAILDHDRTVAVLTELRGAGMQVAIDDFGAGHSSLTRLKDLPADILKIDRGIIADVGVSREARAIVSAAVSLADELGIQTVAEGIETDEQRKFLVHAGCTHGQGFMLGRPAASVPRG